MGAGYYNNDIEGMFDDHEDEFSHSEFSNGTSNTLGLIHPASEGKYPG